MSLFLLAITAAINAFLRVALYLGTLPFFGRRGPRVSKEARLANLIHSSRL